MKKSLTSKKQPKWLEKIAHEQSVSLGKAAEGRFKLIEEKIALEDRIAEINAKYKTDFSLEDFFGITMEEEMEVLDITDGWDDDEEC